ncbi:girdin-like isoform X2 [Mya arenaria]|uniref:girdin-like isoform X2 n=1 Tax=Mya arenaria TaxID=6604 RepID=UPI0022E8543D|nr:girdin-like isoform X2 [Mya arenaria]
MYRLGTGAATENRQNGILRNQLSEFETSFDASILNVEITREKEQISELNQQLDETKQTITKLNETVAENEKKIEVLKCEVRQLSEEKDQLSGYSETNKTRIEELQKKVTDKNEKIKEIEKENRTLIKYIEDQNGAVAELTKQLEYMTKLAQLRWELQNKTEEIGILQNQLSEYATRIKQLEKYCLLYYWLHSDCHVSLQTPTGTYISIHPPGTKGFHPNQLNVVHSLEEDIKRLGDPAEIIPLGSLNFDEIDKWHITTDVRNLRWTEDYSMLETALRKGSKKFDEHLAKHKPSNPRTKSPLYIYAAAWDHSHS